MKAQERQLSIPHSQLPKLPWQKNDWPISFAGDDWGSEQFANSKQGVCTYVFAGIARVGDRNVNLNCEQFGW
jgi:hypothetical protein